MIHFSQYRKIYALISLLVILSGIYSLIRFGLRPSIDFTGGALVEYAYQNSFSHEEVITAEASKIQLEVFSVQLTNNNTVIIRLNPTSQEKVTELKNNLAQATGQDITEVRFETVGPTLGRELLIKTFYAILLAIAAILLYIAWSFKNITYGISAIGALLHDLLVLIGTFSILGHFLHVEVDALFVTAVLTTLSFSVHDTIVVFHRIREINKITPYKNLTQITDIALSETMVRSVNNSITIIFMLLSLVILGGETIRWFAFALLVGVITGTYSSPFVAVPILLFLSKFRGGNKV
ncbi:protein translocase subunit SecF [Candidatus Gottesmanbacteria bacterium]|nr:protein translocase subunit SecF [Candidatus Gottesmanbacteria bacterium]